MRNPSKNTIKKLMRRAYLSLSIGTRYHKSGIDYYLFNTIGARLYIISKGKICNLEPKGYIKHCKPQYNERLKEIESFNKLISANK